MNRAMTFRDRAIVLCLLDSGLRASELSALKVGDVDEKSGAVTVKHGITGGVSYGGKFHRGSDGTTSWFIDI